MKDKIKNIAEKLEHQIRMHELDLNDRIKDIPQIILLLEQGFSELKEIVSFYKFKSEMDEIFFFKIIKPKFFSKLIYYRKVYNIEMMRPNGQDCVLKNYFINELNQLENFYNKNIDFYKYYRSGSTHLDKYFFLRGKQDIQMTMETFYFERDPNFSTICDFKVAKIVANEMLRIYLNIRRVFDVCKPILEDAEQLIQKESKSREICGLQMNESKTPAEVLKLMDEKWNELYEYFNIVETSIEEKANLSYLAEYNTEKKQLEDYIYGPDSYVLKRIEEQVNTITSPEDFQIQCDYTKESSLLSLIVVFPSDHLLNQLSETASLYSTGKLSVKAKAKKDIELEQSLFYSGIGFYLASLCFNVSANIHRIRLSVTRPNEGLYWVEFNRSNFSRLKSYSLNPIIEVQNLPNVSKLNAAGNFVGIPITKFTTQVQQQSIMLDASYATGSDVTFVMTVEDAKLICNHINDNAELSELIKKVEPLGGNTIIVNKRYEKILKEIKSIHS